MDDEVLFCHYEDKKCYTKADAQSVIEACSYKNHKQRQKNVPRRCYYCEQCGYYHLTHIVAPKVDKIRDKNKMLAKNRKDEKYNKKLIKSFLFS